MSSSNNRLRAIAHLIILQGLLPFSLTYVLVQWLRRIFVAAKQDDAAPESTESEDDSSTSSPTPADTDKIVYSVVLTGAKMSKTLHLIRCLRSYADANPDTVQLTITVLESQRFQFNATRFSRCVDHFVPITSPRDGLEQAYMDDIFNACQKYKATHFLPVAAPVEAIYDARLKTRLESELDVTVLHMNSKLCCILDDKHKFGCFLRDTLKVESLRTHEVTSNDQVQKWNKVFQEEREAGKLPRNMVLKNLQYDPIHRLDLFQLPLTDETVLDEYLEKIQADGNPITQQEPWQLQEFLSAGTEYAAMIVVRSNHLVTMTCCHSSASQLNYIHVEVPAVRRWLDSFMAALQKRRQEHPDDDRFELTGQLCFDFMVVKEEDGSEKAYPIECNPRVHTQCTIYSADDTRAALGAMLLTSGVSDGKDDSPTDLEKKMISLLDRDYGVKSKQPECYWFYNEFFKIFPNGYLLQYCDDKDLQARRNMVASTASCDIRKAIICIIYLPSFLFAFFAAIPVAILQLQLLTQQSKSDSSSDLSLYQHSVAVLLKGWDFVDKLADTEKFVEADMWDQDPVPFLAKNHIQVPVRLLATIRTGVEWKKIDFAIGKVVEVGGD